MAKFGHFRRRSCRPYCSERAEAIGSYAKLAPPRTVLDRCAVRDGARIRRSDPQRLGFSKYNQRRTTATAAIRIHDDEAPLRPIETRQRAR